MTENNNNVYTYKAPTESERRRAESIVKEYIGKDSQNPYERLLLLDKKVKTPPIAVSLTLGIVGILIFGLGMAMCLEWSLFLWGAIVAAIGIVPLALAYPVYSLLLKRNKKKYGEQILKLGEELLK